MTLRMDGSLRLADSRHETPGRGPDKDLDDYRGTEERRLRQRREREDDYRSRCWGAYAACRGMPVDVPYPRRGNDVGRRW
jgi:hypothetical protein